MSDKTHLMSLLSRLGNEKTRLAQATEPKEIALRKVWVAQLEKEVAAEEKFLGLTPADSTLSDEDLLAELDS